MCLRRSLLGDSTKHQQLGFSCQSAFPSPLCQRHKTHEKSGAYSLPVSVSPVADLRFAEHRASVKKTKAPYGGPASRLGGAGLTQNP